MGSIITVLFAGISAMLLAPSVLSFGGALAQRKAAEQQAKYAERVQSKRREGGK